MSREKRLGVVNSESRNDSNIFISYNLKFEISKNKFKILFDIDEKKHRIEIDILELSDFEKFEKNMILKIEQIGSALKNLNEEDVVNDIYDRIIQMLKEDIDYNQKIAIHILEYQRNELINSRSAILKSDKLYGCSFFENKNKTEFYIFESGDWLYKSPHLNMQFDGKKEKSSYQIHEESIYTTDLEQLDLKIAQIKQEVLKKQESFNIYD